MMKVIGFTLSAIFFLLSFIHLYWGFGGMWGVSSVMPINQNGEKLLKPGCIGSFIVAIGLALIGLLFLIKIGMIHFLLPAFILKNGLWLIAFLFLIRAIGDFKYVGFFKKIKSTPFGMMDTSFYSPFCLIVAALTTILQLMNI